MPSNKKSNMYFVKSAICNHQTDPWYSPVWNEFNENFEKKNLFAIVKSDIIGNKYHEKWHSPTEKRNREPLDEKSGKIEKLSDSTLDEVALERYIFKINEGKNLGYQWCVGNSRESIDLVHVEDSQLLTLIELKVGVSDKPCSPLLSFFESVKNYYLTKNYLQKYNKKHSYSIKEICLVAPKEYYLKTFNENKAKFFMNKVLPAFKDVEFNMYYIDLKQEELNEDIKMVFCPDKDPSKISDKNKAAVQMQEIFKHKITSISDWKNLTKQKRI